MLSIAGVLGVSLLFLSSFCKNFYAWAFIYLLSYGFVGGVGYTVPIHHAWLWFPEIPGTATGIALSGFGIS